MERVIIKYLTRSGRVHIFWLVKMSLKYERKEIIMKPLLMEQSFSCCTHDNRKFVTNKYNIKICVKLSMCSSSRCFIWISREPQNKSHTTSILKPNASNNNKKTFCWVEISWHFKAISRVVPNGTKAIIQLVMSRAKSLSLN